MTGALKTRNACAANAISQTCHQKKCPIFSLDAMCYPLTLAPMMKQQKKIHQRKKEAL